MSKCTATWTNRGPRLPDLFCEKPEHAPPPGEYHFDGTYEGHWTVTGGVKHIAGETPPKAKRKVKK